MFYYVSKIAWFFATPSNLLLSLVVIGLLLALTRRLRQTGIFIALTFTLATIAFGLLPLANYLFVPLEGRFPVFRDDNRPIDGIILLGGSVDAQDSVNRNALVVNEAAERVLDAIQLSHRYPDARILIVGGGGTVFGDGTAEAPVTAAFMKTIGIDPARILIEDRSRTTYENAVLSVPIAQPKEGERWLLVTSAWHMPRAVGVFEKAGFPVVPYPVDYRVGGSFRNVRGFATISDGLRRFDVGAKEWAGLLAYYLSGRMDALFPGPQAPESTGSVSR
ncbi:YdcF family protein [Microvirga sp. GCM10011540]|uniref:YdcF family protein n=1 Tax=Microvirga sp. GCM10011540 TaxID=3317338 RepID=UPI0036132C03